MSRKIDPADIDNAVRLYLSGESIEKIHATTGVSNSVLCRQRKARGIPPRSQHACLPTESIIAAYLAGASEYALGRQYGVSRAVIGRHLAMHGVPRRGPSEAGLVRAAQMTPEERQRQAAPSHALARLRRYTMLDKCRRALLIEHRAEFASDGEAKFAGFLDERRLPYVAQRAIGIYNVDFAITPVAVEILGGGWHSVKASHAQRTPDILDEGWHLVMVWDYEGRSALGAGAADYLVSFLEEIRWHPPATCQYRVVTGQGELLTARGREDDEFPLVPPPRGR